MILPQQSAVIIIGAGVSGLTTALEISKTGRHVIVIAQHDASHTPSVVAGALWEWPPAVCGHHSDEQSLARSKPWCVESYQRFLELSHRRETGVSIRRSTFYFYEPVESSAFEWAKMQEARMHVEGFVHDRDLIERNGINPELALQDAYSYMAPTIHTRIYMQWLQRELVSRGVQFVCRHIEGHLRDQLGLLREFRAEWIVNCTGLGARTLVPDDVFPLRGALVRVDVPCSDSKLLEGAHCISHDDNNPKQNMIYIIPRGDRLLLGGIAQADQWDTSIDLDNYPELRQMVDRCREFLPALADLPISVTNPVRVGLRPARRQNVCLRKEPDAPIVHNYGHGGSGFTLSWGCAKEVAGMI